MYWYLQHQEDGTHQARGYKTQTPAAKHLPFTQTEFRTFVMTLTGTDYLRKWRQPVGPDTAAVCT